MCLLMTGACRVFSGFPIVYGAKVHFNGQNVEDNLDSLIRKQAEINIQQCSAHFSSYFLL